MADRRIEIQMAAVGAAETASDISRSTDAVQDLTKATEGNNEANQEAATSARQQTQINIERAETLEKVGRGFEAMGRGIAAAAEKFKESDPEFSETLKHVSEGFESAGKMAEMAVQGFIIAGPAGAAAGATIGAAVGPIQEAFNEMNAAMAQNAAASEALETADVRRAQGEIERVARMRTSGMIALLKDQAEETRALTAEMARLAQVEAAQDSLDSAKRDRADDARIAAGEDPAVVKGQRISDDAGAAKARNNRALRDKLALRDDALAGSMKADALASEAGEAGGDSEKAKDLADKAAVKRAAAMEAAANYSAQQEVTRRRNEEVDERAALQQEQVRRAAEERRIAAEDAQANKGNAAAEKAQRDAATAESRRQSEARRTASGTFGVARDAAGLGAGEAGIAGLLQRAAAVNANPSAANEAALVKMLDQLLRHIEKIGPGDQAKKLELEGRIRALERREKAK